MSNFPKLSSARQARAQSNYGRRPSSSTCVLEISPSEVVFPDTAPNKIYEHEILIRNLSKTPKRIKIVQPSTSKFRVDYTSTSAIASGLYWKLTCIYECTQALHYYDHVKILTEDGQTFKIPIQAQPAKSQFIYEKNLNFGLVEIDAVKTIPLKVKNAGQLPAKFELAELPSCVRVNNQGVIPPGDSRVISIECEFAKQGIFKQVITVKQDGVVLREGIDLSATVLEYNQYILGSDDSFCELVNFGQIYYGQVVEQQYFLLNNSPEVVEFKSLIMKGNVSRGENSKIQNPVELGAQMTQRIITCSPASGVLQPYEKLPMSFKCDVPVTDDLVQAVKDFAKDQNLNRLIKNPLIYTAMFQFNRNKSQKPFMIQLNGEMIIPTLKVNLHELQFGTCKLNEKRDIIVQITNIHQENSLELSFEKLAFVHVTPSTALLKPRQIYSFQFSFQPKKLGPLNKILHICLMNDRFRVPLEIRANCAQIGFVEPSKGLDRNEFDRKLEFVQDQTDNDLFMTTQEELDIVPREDHEHVFLKSKKNANQYLVDQRRKRVQSAQVQHIKRLQSAGGTRALQSSRPEGKQKLPLPDPIEQIQKGLDSPKMGLPKQKDNFFVLKPIGQYTTQLDNDFLHFNPDPNVKVRVKFASECKNYLEKKQVSQELTGEQLQRIFAGPKVIDFGQINVKSIAERSFHIRNDLTQCISVKVVCSGNELSLNPIQTQIIPPGRSTSFDVLFQSANEQTYSGFVKYIINKSHTFFFQIDAKILPVKLSFQKDTVKLAFSEDSEELHTADTVRVVNQGNSEANFRWEASEKTVFKVSPAMGSVKPNSFKDCTVTYCPQGTGNGKQDEDVLIMKVDHGDLVQLKCIGQTTESKCVIQEKEISFGTIPVCKRVEAVITVKNAQKFFSIFNVDDKLPPHTEVEPMKGRLGPDQTQVIKVTYYNKNASSISSDIRLMFRGSKPIVIPFQVQTLIPDISIIEHMFDFGSVTTLENSPPKTMTIVNKSPVGAILYLDLREKPDSLKENQGLECITVAPQQGEDREDHDVSVMKSVNEDDLADDINNMQAADANSSQASNESFENKESSRQYIIKIAEHSQLIFDLKFQPKDVKEYHLQLPISLYGYGKLNELNKQIYCKGIKPKFIMRPHEVEFKKKLVLPQIEKCYASFQDILITNPENKLLYWKIDTTNLTVDKVFKLSPSTGRLDGGASVVIKVAFNPTTAGEFSQEVPLYLDNDFTKPYYKIPLTGFSQYPRLSFDRREVIIPVTPLGVPSTASFYILNDGYENFTLKHQVSQEYGPLDVEVVYSEGAVIGLQKNRLRVDMRFCSSRVQSFTTRVDFYDDNMKSYSIFVSGTTDNSLITSCSYLQRNPGSFELVAEDNKGVMLQLFAGEESDDPEEKKSQASKSQRSYKNVLGYATIPHVVVDRTLESICRWFNLNVMVEKGPMSSFPQDLIKHNGSQLFDLVYFLTNKTLNCKMKMDMHTKRLQKVQNLIKQYEDFLRHLKENGALLNTLRPWFLLSFSDYQTYMKQTSHEHPNVQQKLNEQAYNYLSNDAWIQVFYQTIRVFYLLRVNKNILKTLPGASAQQQIIPDHYLDKSNLYSSYEGIILRWLEVNSEIVLNSTKRLTNFDEDLKNSLVYAACIKNYVGKNSQKILSLMKKNCVSDEDYIYNAEKLFQMLDEIGIITHFTKKDLIYGNARDNVIFSIQLMQALPHYIPKGQPIVFSCVLGEEIMKEIQLTNPSNKSISYWVHYEGHQDFRTKDIGNVDEDCVKIDPRSSIVFKVKFRARISIQVEGRLIFTNKKEGSVQASAMVFDLKSEVTSRKSIETWNCQAQLYKCEEIKLQVTNFFTNSTVDFAEFQIQIIHEKKPPKEVVQAKPVKKKKKKEDVVEEVVYEDNSIPEAFFTLKEKIKLKRGESTNIVLQFMPFKMENYKCYVIFQDVNVGEFQHEVLGETLLPDMQEEVKHQNNIFVDAQFKFDLPISFKNSNIQNLRKKHEQRLLQAGKIKERDAYMNKVQAQPVLDYLDFDVLINPVNTQQIQCPLLLKLVNNSIRRPNQAEFEKGLTAKGEVLNKIPVGLLFKHPVKDYAFQVIIKNKTLTDIRIFRVVISVIPRPIKAVLELRVPFGDEVKQEIPIINTADKEVIIKVNLEGDHGFFGPKELHLKKSQTGYYPLLFRPEASGSVEGKLLLLNPITFDHFEFKLMGITDEPIALDHLLIKCIAKQTTHQLIPITNRTLAPITYLVETDLISPEGADKITLTPGQTSNYLLKVTPMLGGLYNGSITFIDQQNKDNYIWFTVQLDIERPPCAKKCEVVTQVRKPVIFETTLNNPEPEELTFEVVAQGDALAGESYFTIPAKSSKTYELMFLPLKPLSSYGVLSFMHPKLGEVWYELHLVGTNPPIKQLCNFSSEIGKYHEQTIELDNPSRHDVKIVTTNSNSLNFQIFPKDIFIKAFQAAPVTIRFTPTEVNHDQDAILSFASQQIGEFRYQVSGVGSLPTSFSQQSFTGVLDQEMQFQVTFKNPYDTPINYQCSIETDYPQNFRLLNKKNSHSANGQQSTQIPFMFMPEQIREYHAVILVKMSDEIQWRYPVKGITEVTINTPILLVQTVCRQPCTRNIELELPGLPPTGKEKILYDLQNIPAEYKQMVANCFNVKVHNNVLDENNSILQYDLEFAPQKPFKINIDFILKRVNGGQWKYKMQLISNEPEEHDTIVISSLLNKTTTVSFKLQGRNAKSTAFKAYFAKESDTDFTVSPRQGDFNGFGAEPQNFLLTFTPLEYKLKFAKLIIETEDYYWSFVVKGEYHNFKPAAKQAPPKKVEEKRFMGKLQPLRQND